MAGTQCKEWRVSRVMPRVTRIHSMHRRRLRPTRASRCHRLLQRTGDVFFHVFLHVDNPWQSRIALWIGGSGFRDNIDIYRSWPFMTIPHCAKMHQNVPKVESGDLRSLRNFKAALPPFRIYISHETLRGKWMKAFLPKTSTVKQNNETVTSCDSCFVAWASATQQRIWDRKADRKVGKDDCFCEKKNDQVPTKIARGRQLQTLLQMLEVQLWVQDLGFALFYPVLTLGFTRVPLRFHFGSTGGNGHLKFRNNQSSSFSVMSSPDALALRFLNFLSLAAQRHALRLRGSDVAISKLLKAIWCNLWVLMVPVNRFRYKKI